jgi:hypothetical protein
MGALALTVLSLFDPRQPQLKLVGDIFGFRLD